MKKLKSIFKLWNARGLFIPRFIIWLTGLVILPVVFINYKFKVIQYVQGKELKVSWWLIGILILLIIVCVFILKTFLKSSSYSFFGQLLSGFVNVVMWLLIGKFTLEYAVKFNDELMFVINWSILTTSIAVLVNPLPRWEFYRKAHTISKMTAERIK